MPRQPHTIVHAVGGLAILGLLGLPAFGGAPSGSTTSPAYSDTAPTTAAQWQASGSIQGVSTRLLPGCHAYDYRYAVHPAYPDWTLNTFLVGPHGEQLANDAIISGADPTSGVKHFEICAPSTEPGTYAISGTLYYYDYPDTYSGAIATSHFQLTAKPHHKRHRAARARLRHRRHAS